MDGMDYDYENLLKAAYQCDRDPAKGIDADCFCNLIEKEYQSQKAKETLQKAANEAAEAAYAFGIVIGEISTQIYLALETVIRNRQKELSPEQIKKLQDYKTQLREPNITVNAICDIVERVKPIIKF